VYLNHPPRHALAQSHEALVALRAAGLEPVAHIAARRLASRAELDSFLERAAGEAALSKVLLLGGDEPRPRGPYACGADLLREGMFARYGVREVGVPGYPEGHPVIARAEIDRALQEKLALLAAQGLSAHIVTQFSFAPTRVLEYCTELARKFPELAVYVGLAGPTEAHTLLRFAQRCGVSASLRALRAQGMGAVRLFMNTDPREQLAAIARHCAGTASSNVIGAHLFTFGGVAKTAAWINREIAALGGAS
jgi:methylenetetrahydrofolate reductase (NADPH)